jgi:hypothetical protein
MQLGRTVSTESADDAQVVTQPTEGQPTVQSTDAVLADQQKASDAAQAVADKIPADGSVPAEDIQGVSQESQGALETAPVATEITPAIDGKQSDADGSLPATPSDEPGDAAARADMPVAGVQATAQPAAQPSTDAVTEATADKSTPAVSQESEGSLEKAPVATETTPAVDGKESDADGSQPAAASDKPGDDAARADQPQAAAGTPAELAPEMEMKDPKAAQPHFDAQAPQKADVAADPNNPSVEQLSPEDIAQVAQVAAAAGAAAAGGEAAPAADASADAGAVEEVPVEAVAEQPGVAAAEVVAEAGAENVETAGNDDASAAAQAAADTVAAEADPEAAAGPNAGDAAATPAEAAQVVADLIADNPDNAAEIASAVDKVADAAVMATDGSAQINENVDAGADAAADAAAEEAAAEADAADEAVEAESDDLDEIDDISDEAEVSQESLISARGLLASLEDIVETALAQGGLSDDAAQILQRVTDHVTDEAGVDDADLGLESLAYTDRVIATEYAKGRLKTAIESIDGELQISTEGLLDIFRSFAGKTKNWAEESLAAISKARAAINDRNAKADVEIKLGEAGNVKSATTNTFGLLSALVGDYNGKVLNAGKTMADAVSDLNDGDFDYDEANANVGRVDIPMPNGFSKDIHGAKATPALLGGTQLLVALRGAKSEAEMVTVKGTTSVTVSASEALAMLDEAEKYLRKVQHYVTGMKSVDKAIDNSAKHQSETATKSFMFTGIWALLYSADYRRSWYRVFKSDEQKGKLGELKAAFQLTKESIGAGRAAVSTVLSVAKKFR